MAEIQKKERVVAEDGQYRRKQTESLENIHTRERTELQAAQEKERRGLDSKLKVQEEKHKRSLGLLKEASEQLEKYIEKLDAPIKKSDDGVEEAKGQLECPVCMEAMKPPTRIWMCSQTHLICERCRDEVENRLCPTCRSYRIKSRAFFAENMARSLFKNENQN